MIKMLKKYGIIIAFVAGILLFLIPLGINVAFKQSWGISWLEAEWAAGDVLAFYGSIVAGLLTVFGVFITICYSQKNYRDDVRKRVLPFIAIDILRTKSKRNLFCSSNETPPIESDSEKEGYTEYKLEDCYCVLENGSISYKPHLTKRQKKLLDDCGTRIVSRGHGSYSYVSVDEVCVPIEIENVGNGAAVGLRYGLNRITVIDDEKRFLTATSLKSGYTRMFHIFSEDCGENSPNLGTYELAVHYEDIYANKYSQKFIVYVEYSMDDRQPIVSVDMSGEQEFDKDKGGSI